MGTHLLPSISPMIGLPSSAALSSLKSFVAAGGLYPAKALTTSEEVIKDASKALYEAGVEVIYDKYNQRLIG